MRRSGQLRLRDRLGLDGVALRPLFHAPGAALALGLTILTGPSHARAALGRTYDSVEADRAHLSARLSSSAASDHTVHTLTLANGGVVREFMRRDGVIFAIAWRAPGRPDLRQLLGDRFDTLQADNATGGSRRIRRSMAVDRQDLIVRSNGHPGGFWGLAYLPQQAPAGFSTRELP